MIFVPRKLESLSCGIVPNMANSWIPLRKSKVKEPWYLNQYNTIETFRILEFWCEEGGIMFTNRYRFLKIEQVNGHGAFPIEGEKAKIEEWFANLQQFHNDSYQFVMVSQIGKANVRERVYLFRGLHGRLEGTGVRQLVMRRRVVQPSTTVVTARYSRHTRNSSINVHLPKSRSLVNSGGDQWDGKKYMESLEEEAEMVEAVAVEKERGRLEGFWGIS